MSMLLMERMRVGFRVGFRAGFGVGSGFRAGFALRFRAGSGWAQAGSEADHSIVVRVGHPEIPEGINPRAKRIVKGGGVWISVALVREAGGEVVLTQSQTGVRVVVDFRGGMEHHHSMVAVIGHIKCICRRADRKS